MPYSVAKAAVRELLSSNNSLHQLVQRPLPVQHTTPELTASTTEVRTKHVSALVVTINRVIERINRALEELAGITRYQIAIALVLVIVTIPHGNQAPRERAVTRTSRGNELLIGIVTQQPITAKKSNIAAR